MYAVQTPQRALSPRDLKNITFRMQCGLPLKMPRTLDQPQDGLTAKQRRARRNGWNNR